MTEASRVYGLIAEPARTLWEWHSANEDSQPGLLESYSASP